MGLRDVKEIVKKTREWAVERARQLYFDKYIMQRIGLTEALTAIGVDLFNEGYPSPRHPDKPLSFGGVHGMIWPNGRPDAIRRPGRKKEPDPVSQFLAAAPMPVPVSMPVLKLPKPGASKLNIANKILDMDGDIDKKIELANAIFGSNGEKLV